MSLLKEIGLSCKGESYEERDAEIMDASAELKGAGVKGCREMGLKDKGGESLSEIGLDEKGESYEERKT